MMPLFSASPQKEPVLLIDVGSSSVGAALVLVDKNGPPRVLASKRNLLQLEEQVNFDKFFGSMLATVQLTVNEVLPLCPKKARKGPLFSCVPVVRVADKNRTHAQRKRFRVY